jgi:hypothetical protein
VVGSLTKPRIATLENGNTIERFFKDRREILQRSPTVHVNESDRC